MFGGFLDSLQSLTAHNELQSKVGANNIANSNTPGYKSKKVSDIDFSAHIKPHLRTTREQHIVSSENNKIETTPKLVAGNNMTTLDGNNVDVGKEMVDMLKSNFNYQLNLNAINKEFELFRNAIGR